MAAIMDDQLPGPDVATTSIRASFASERSQQDARMAGENSRATAQVAIIINGGAATAVLAFLAKDKLDPNLLRVAAASLSGYVLGVFAGSAMMYCLFGALRRWSFVWRLRAEGRNHDVARKKAFRWEKLMALCFLVSTLSFLFSSAVIAFALYHSTTP